MKTDCKDIIDAILTSANSDATIARLIDNVIEYSRMYSYIKQRQKGCDGLGELNNLKDELRVALEDLIAKCRERQHPDLAASYDIEGLIEAAAKLFS